MIFYCDLQGNLKAFQNETVYQGSNNVTTIYVVAPFNRPVGLNISFTKPNKLVTSPAIMKWVGTLGNVKIPVSFVNIPEQFTDTYNVWAYALPYSITEQSGVVGVSVNAVIADSVDESGQQAYRGNLTTFTGQFTVAYSALPSPPTDIPTEWTQDKVLDLLNNYYNDAIQKIGEMNTLKTNAKDTLVKAINEVFDEIATTNATIGNLSTLTTDEKTTIVGAINEVDNHADTAQQTAETAQTTADNATGLANNAVATANGAVATANEAKTTAQTAENNANSAVDKADSAIDRANKAYEKAANNVYAVGFMTLQEAITAVNGYDNTVLKTNDNILVVAQGSPDLYVTSVEATNIPYNFTTVDKFNDDLVKNTVLQIGYYKVAFYETDGQPVTVAYQNVVVKSTDWVASTEFADFPYEAKIELTDFVDYTTVPQVVFDIADTMSGNYAPICKSGDKCVYIYGKVQNEITLKTVITFAPNVNGASVTGGGYNNRGKWVASTTYAIDDLVYTDNGQFVCIEGITSTTSPEQDTTHWQATFVATGKTKNGLKFSGQNTDGSAVQKTFDGSTAVEVAFDETTMTAKEVNGVLKVGAKGTIPEALPQEASALKSGNLPTSGWSTLDEGWLQNTLPASRNWQSVTYGDGKYVAVAYDSASGAYSTDGITWTEMTMPANRSWYSITYGDGKFVAVAASSQSGAYSTDGIHWTEFTLPASKGWYGVTYGNGKFVAVAGNSDKGAYSTDGIHWTTMTLPSSSDWQSVTYGDGKFVAVAYYTNKGAYSTDGITWTEFTFASNYWKRVTYGNGKFVAVASSTQYGSLGAYSTDGISWSTMTLPTNSNWSSVTYGDGKFVAVAASSQSGAYSTDGIHWTEFTLPASRSWYGVTYGNGKFVAVARSSANGAYWKAAAQVTYTISDTSITTNSDVLMELTDEGGVKAHALASGSITVIRDTVPTHPIPYTYKVKQTNTSGQFTVLNHFAGVTSVNGQTGAVTIDVPTKTSQLENDSGYVRSVVPPVVQNVVCNDVDSATTLDTTITCEVGDLILAQIIVRSALTLPTGWTLLRTIPAVETSVNQTLSFAYKRATSTSETLTVTQATAGRIYTNLVRLSNAVSISYIQSCEKTGTGIKSILSTKPVTPNMVIWGAASQTWRTTSPYGDWTYSPSTLDYYSLPQSTRAPRLGTFIDSSGAGERTFTIPSDSSNSMMCGAVEIVGDEVARKGDIPTKTSQLTNDSGFAKTTEANTWTGVQTFSNADGIKTDRVHNLDNNDAWYNFDGSNNRFGSPSRPTIIRTSEARPRAQVPSGETTVTKEIALLEDVPSAATTWGSGAAGNLVLYGKGAGVYQIKAEIEGSPVCFAYWDGTSDTGYCSDYVSMSLDTDGFWLFYYDFYIEAKQIKCKHYAYKINSGTVTKEVDQAFTGFTYRKITN